ncbi:MAG: Fic family protein [Phycisphaerae bacterium]|nr:Fic family protein [Phycisphaerae bacterium]
MARTTGTYHIARVAEEEVKAFVPNPLPPADPPLVVDEAIQRRLDCAMAGLSRLDVATNLVPDSQWFLYSFVRKESLITSQIEGTQATLQDVLAFEVGQIPERPDDVQEVCNYIAALKYARRELAHPRGLPLSMRLLCETHRRLMGKGVRGSDKQPGEIRRSQNWIGGSRPGNAHFVPPPPELVSDALSLLEKWIHGSGDLPPLIRVGLAHVQFETIHPFLDGNGRIGRLLITLLVEHWKLLSVPLLYLSVAFKRHQAEYYARLDSVRIKGDWEGWTRFFLDCVAEAADDAVTTAQRLFTQISRDRAALLKNSKATVSALRLFDFLPSNPMMTLPLASKLLKASRPTVLHALTALESLGILKEFTGKQRDRAYAYHHYIRILARDT